MHSNLWMLTGWLAHSSFFLFWQSGWWCTACQGSGYSECRYWQHQVLPIPFSCHPRTLTVAHRCRFWRPASSKQVSVWSLWSHLLEGLWVHQDLRGQGHYIKRLVHKKNDNSVIIHPPSFCPKPAWVSSIRYNRRRNWIEETGCLFTCNYNEWELKLSSFKKNAKAP